MSESFEVVLNDGFGNRLTFNSEREISAFLDREEEAWSWLVDAPHTYVRLNSTPGQHLQTARTWLSNITPGSWKPSDYATHLNQLYAQNSQALMLSDFEPGANVNLIREKFGEAMGEMAYGMITGQYRPDIREDLRAFRVWQMLAAPTIIADEAWGSEHRRKLGTMRAQVGRELSSIQSNEEQRSKASAEFYNEQRALLRGLGVRAAKIGSRRATSISDKARQAVTSIEATEAAYSLQMGLKAPVQYWRAKQRAHGTAARNWGRALLGYAIVAVVVCYLTVPAVWKVIPENEGLTGRHFVLVAAIGAALTTLFWVARLLMRIYLGERHLATDAEERRVMTQAYLALMKGDAASNDERAIILAALFRTAQDGIVREEGVGDIGLPAMIAKLLDSKK